MLVYGENEQFFYEAGEKIFVYDNFFNFLSSSICCFFMFVIKGMLKCLKT